MCREARRRDAADAVVPQNSKRARGRPWRAGGRPDLGGHECRELGKAGNASSHDRPSGERKARTNEAREPRTEPLGDADSRDVHRGDVTLAARELPSARSRGLVD